MKSLSKDWITEKHIDLEYKKYVLLAYLQEVSNNFEENKIYPFLSDLINHYKRLIDLRKDTINLQEQFPDKLKGIEVGGDNSVRLLYEKLYQNNDLIQELESIISYSIPQIEQYLKDGKRLYDFIENLFG